MNFRLRFLFKAGRGRPPAPAGAVREWKDGTRRRKQADGSWAIIGHTGKRTARPTLGGKRSYSEKKNRRLFSTLEGETGTLYRAAFEELQDEHKVYDYESLVEHAKKHGLSGAFRTVRSAIRSEGMDVAQDMGVADEIEEGTLSPKAARIVHRMRAAEKKFGELFSRVQANVYARQGRKKPKMRFEPDPEYKFVTGGSTGETYVYEGRYKRREYVPDWQPQQIASAVRMLGGWKDMNKKPTRSQLGKMLERGTAEKTRGEYKSGVAFTVPTRYRDFAVPFKADEKGVWAKLQQRKPGDQRDTVLSEYRVYIPYEFVRDFLDANNVPVKTRSRIVKEMERSAGYKRVAEGLERVERNAA